MKSRISVALTYLNISLSDINVKYFSWTFFRQMVESTEVATTAALKFGQIMLDVCSSFALEVDMSFNSSKSVVMHVGTRFKLPRAPVMLRSSMTAQLATFTLVQGGLFYQVWHIKLIYWSAKGMLSYNKVQCYFGAASLTSFFILG